MEVVRSNFKDYVDSVLKDIELCDFISMDGEFTGISNDKFKIMPFDTVAERYEKLRKGNMDYLMCQVGLCMFFQTADGSYKVKSYNFYICPQQFFRKPTDRSPEFVCQASCIQFLGSHGFDFNKVFLEGIPYLLPSEESRLRDELIEKDEMKSTQTSTPLTVKGDDKKFVDSLIERVDKFLKEESPAPIALEPCSPWRRKITYQYLRAKYPDSIYLQAAGEGRQRHITVAKVDTEEKRAREKAGLDKKLAELTDAVGFSRVVRAISNSQKIVVGHNMLLDTMYLVSQFLAHLPDSYEEFKCMVKELLPKLLDTKVMSSTYLFKEEIPFNSLEELVTKLESPLYQPVTFEVPAEFPQYETDSAVKFHDAAFDAYCTGKCFAIMADHVGRQAKPAVSNLASCSALLTPFTNKLFVHRIQDIPYMNLGGPEVLVTRDHLYHLSFPKTWTRDDINQVFFPSMIYVNWIDSTAAMVSLQQRSENAEVKKRLQSTAHGCVVLSYKEWHRNEMAKSANPSADGDNGTRKVEKRKLHSGSEVACKIKASSNKMADEISSTPEDDSLAEKSQESKSEKLFEESSW